MRVGVTGIILAGGNSRRFNVGKVAYLHKGLAPLQGKPLIIHVLEKLYPICSNFLIVVNTERVKQDFDQVFMNFSPKFSQCDVKVVIDQPFRVQGPLRGLLTGLSHVREEYVITSACDTLMPSLLVERMIDIFTREEVDVVIIQNVRQKLESAIMGLKLSPAFWSKLHQLGSVPRGRLADVVRLASSVGLIVLARDIITNINTRNEWRLAETRGLSLDLVKEHVQVKVLRKTASASFERYMKAMQAGDPKLAVYCLKNELQQLKKMHFSSLAAHVEKDLLNAERMLNQEREKV